MNIAPSVRTDLFVLADARQARSDLFERFKDNLGALGRLGRINEVHFQNSGYALNAQSGEQIEVQPNTFEGKTAFHVVTSEAAYDIPLEGVIDIAAEQARLTKAKAASEKERDNLAKRLGNPAFAEKAKPEAVKKARADHAHHAAEVERLTAALARLG